MFDVFFGKLLNFNLLNMFQYSCSYKKEQLRNAECNFKIKQIFKSSLKIPRQGRGARPQLLINAFTRWIRCCMIAQETFQLEHFALFRRTLGYNVRVWIHFGGWFKVNDSYNVIQIKTLVYCELFKVELYKTMNLNTHQTCLLKKIVSTFNYTFPP